MIQSPLALAIDVERILYNGRVKLGTIQNGREVIRHGKGFGLLGPDETEIRADHELGVFFREELTKLGGLAGITIEGDHKRNPVTHAESGLIAFCDPLDGSESFYNDRETLPHGACITLFERRPGQPLLYRDIVAAAAIDYRIGRTWRVRREAWTEIGTPGKYLTFVNGVPARVQDVEGLDIGNQRVYYEMYYPRMRADAAKHFGDKKGGIRSLGSALLEMLAVSHGKATLFACSSQKAHEAPIGIVATLGAGGVAWPYALGASEGQILDLEYDFNKQIEVVLAANAAVATDFLTPLLTPSA